MKTTLEKIVAAERWRIKVGDKRLPRLKLEEIASTKEDGFNGHFLVPAEGELWFVRLSDGWGWRHASITNAQRKLLPSWNVMCRIKESFWGDDCWVCQLHPPPGENVNDHPFCLHLWQPLEESLPTPPVILV